MCTATDLAGHAAVMPDPDRLQRLLLPALPPHQQSAKPQAAVLLLLCPGTSGSAILLTRRSEALPLHAGQICLPGGRVAAGDTSLEATALREAQEETGLVADTVRVLGRLPVAQVSSGFDVTPVVAWTAARPVLVPDPREVVELIEAPLATLLDLAAYKQDSSVREGAKRTFYYIEFTDYYVWGATAAMLRSLALAVSSTHAGGPR